MPRRRRTRGRRPRETQQREGVASPPPETRPAISTVTREETAERPEPPRRVSPSTATAARTAARHISRDYSYVPGELKRIGITVGIIIVSLITAAFFLR